MKKTLLAILLNIITFTGFAQSINFGVKAGLNLSNQTFSTSQFKLDNSNLIGFHVGAIADIGFENVSLQPGVFFSTKGNKAILQATNQNQQSAGTTLQKTTLDYIEIPINILYKIPVAPGFRIFLGGGPYLGYGISGKFSVNGTEADLHFGGNEGYNNPDFGLNFIAGLEIIKRFTINANYGLGITNLSSADGSSIKNRVISVSAGYFFR